MFRFYSRPAGTSRVAIAGEHSEGMLKMAVAICSSKDQFIKQKGRRIAEGRLMKGKFFKTIPMEQCLVRDFLDAAETVSAEAIKSKKVYQD